MDDYIHSHKIQFQSAKMSLIQHTLWRVYYLYWCLHDNDLQVFFSPDEEGPEGLTQFLLLEVRKLREQLRNSRICERRLSQRCRMAEDERSRAERKAQELRHHKLQLERFGWRFWFPFWLFKAFLSESDKWQFRNMGSIYSVIIPPHKGKMLLFPLLPLYCKMIPGSCNNFVHESSLPIFLLPGELSL